MITVSNLQKIYFKGKTTIPAVNGVSFSVNTGEFVAIVGKSGSGKSTLLNLLAGLDTATSGEIKFDDKDICRISRKELVLHRRNTIGIVFQSFNLVATKTALENVELALTFGGVKKSERKQRAKELLEKVGLGERVDHKPSELSGGEAQRVAIARALANNPPFILADEPTGNLDSNTTKEILHLLKQLQKEEGRTIVMITHDMETAQAVSDKIITISDGKIRDESSAAASVASN
jgi:putative ABC transport system ATP-binding protein